MPATFKRALYVGLEDAGKGVLKYRDKIQRAENEIAELAGIDPHYVLVDIPKTPEMLEMRAMIKTDHRMIPLNEASHFVSILQEAHMDNWRMGVYSPKEHCEAVGKAARDYFDVKKTIKQFKLTDLKLTDL